MPTARALGSHYQLIWPGAWNVTFFLPSSLVRRNETRPPFEGKGETNRSHWRRLERWASCWPSTPFSGLFLQPSLFWLKSLLSKERKLTPHEDMGLRVGHGGSYWGVQLKTNQICQFLSTPVSLCCYARVCSGHVTSWTWPICETSMKGSWVQA